MEWNRHKCKENFYVIILVIISIINIDQQNQNAYY